MQLMKMKFISWNECRVDDGLPRQRDCFEDGNITGWSGDTGYFSVAGGEGATLGRARAMRRGGSVRTTVAKSGSWGMDGGL